MDRRTLGIRLTSDERMARSRSTSLLAKSAHAISMTSERLVDR